MFLGLGGIYGGVAMLSDPTGRAIQMEDILHLLPVPNFILPGLFLFVVMGLLPILLSIGLIREPDWSWANKLSAWSKHYWAWTGTVAVGMTLFVWLAFQGILIGFQWPIQYATLMNGVLIVLTAIIPSIQKYYKL